MRFWLTNVCENLPIDDENVRLRRTGIVAKTLLERGHDVVWWTSNFDHTSKSHRFPLDTRVDVSDRYRIWLLHGAGYKRNISLRRILDHRGIARKFARFSKCEPVPDVILPSLPPLQLGMAAVMYAKENGIPAVVDVRDLWPDTMVDLAPSWATWLAKLPLYPLFRAARLACVNATAIVGITPAFVDWGLAYAKRPRTSADRDFPFGYMDDVPPEAELTEAREFWRALGVREQGKEFDVCFIAAKGRHVELDTVLEAARRLESQDRPIRFILCGNLDAPANGERANVLSAGWIGTPQIYSVMRMASVGLIAYRSGFEFQASMPNKVIEYLSAGLPVVSSIRGYMESFLSVNECGVTYENENPDSLASALCELYDMPERREAMSRNAQSVYREKFIGEKVYGEMADYLEEIAQSMRARQ